MKQLSDWKTLVIFCLTLGLAPFTPEPHIWADIKWIAGGAKGMGLINWWDTFIHGLPWVLLIRALIIKFKDKA